jgi:hypothetical protein
MRASAWRGAASLRRPVPVVDPSLSRIQIKLSDRSAGEAGEWAAMSNAYIIEIGSHTAGIVMRDERGFRFFSSDRIFDSLEGREFRSARDAERAARARAVRGATSPAQRAIVRSVLRRRVMPRS